MFPDMRGEIDQELLRYQLFRFAARVGFSPPYLHSRSLIERLSRYKGPALILYGGDDRMVPRSHAEAYAERLAGAQLQIVGGGGHSIQIECPDEVAALVSTFIAQRSQSPA